MTAAILTKLNSPLEIVECQNAGTLQYGQVRVRVLASGICGRQLQQIRGEAGKVYLPSILGHEGCGEVLEVGQGVTRVKVGDRTILHWREAKGIAAPTPIYTQTSNGQYPVTGGPVHTFATEVIVSENRVTAVPQNTPIELCALLGCSLSTALATIEYEAKLKWGESILIVGCGGLGSNLIRAAKLMHAGRIEVLDRNENQLKRVFKIEDVVRGHTAASNIGHEFDVIIDTSGSHHAISDTIPLLAPSGRYIMLGHPSPTIGVAIYNADHLFGGSGKSIKASQGGSFNPDTDATRYASLVKSGALDISGIVSHRLPLEKINEGLDLVRDGAASRVMIDMTL